MSLVVVIFGGLFAGIATGLVGLSAAAIIVPLLTTLLGVDAYIAVGIALSSDVLASLLSAKMYHKYGNIDVKNGIFMLCAVLVFTFFSSYASSVIDTSHLGSLMNIFALFLGFRFYFRKSDVSKNSNIKHPVLQSVIWGSVIGCICGYIGAGGGLMLLVILVRILGYDTKKAVGTSVFIMGFTALTGAVSHIALGGTNVLFLVVSVISATVGALAASKYANIISEEKSNKVVGIFLILLGIALTVIQNIL